MLTTNSRRILWRLQRRECAGYRDRAQGGWSRLQTQRADRQWRSTKRRPARLRTVMDVVILFVQVWINEMSNRAHKHQLTSFHQLRLSPPTQSATIVPIKRSVAAFPVIPVWPASCAKTVKRYMPDSAKLSHVIEVLEEIVHLQVN